jgi:hypothetical protein
MDYLPSTCPINANFVNLRWIVADIFNMAEDMATPVLTNKISKIGSQTHIRHGRLLSAPLVNWKALEENESLAIKDLITNGSQ